MSTPDLGQRIFAGVVGIVFAGQFLMALRYPSDPRLFPLIISAAGFLLAVALVFGLGLHADDEESAAHTKRPPQFLLTLVVAPIYAFALWLFGYWTASILAIPIVAWKLGYRRKLPLAIATFVVTVLLGVLFPLLEVPLPKGLLPSLMGL
jgi:hypothetical protein